MLIRLPTRIGITDLPPLSREFYDAITYPDSRKVQHLHDSRTSIPYPSSISIVALAIALVIAVNILNVMPSYSTRWVCGANTPSHSIRSSSRKLGDSATTLFRCPDSLNERSRRRSRRELRNDGFPHSFEIANGRAKGRGTPQVTCEEVRRYLRPFCIMPGRHR